MLNHQWMREYKSEINKLKKELSDLKGEEKKSKKPYINQDDIDYVEYLSKNDIDYVEYLSKNDIDYVEYLSKNLSKKVDSRESDIEPQLKKGINFDSTNKLLDQINRVVGGFNLGNPYDDKYWDFIDNYKKEKNKYRTHKTLINNFVPKRKIEKSFQQIITDDNYKKYSITLEGTIFHTDQNVRGLIITKDNSKLSKLLKGNHKRITNSRITENNLTLGIILNSPNRKKINIIIPRIDIRDYMMPYCFYVNGKDKEMLKVIYNVDMSSKKLQKHARKYIEKLDYIESDKLINNIIEEINKFLMKISIRKLNDLKNQYKYVNNEYDYEPLLITPDDLLDNLLDDIDEKSVPNELSEYIEIKDINDKNK